MHEGSECNVRELVYTVLRSGAGTVRVTQMDELIKAFGAATPKPTNMPGSVLRAACFTRWK